MVPAPLEKSTLRKAPKRQLHWSLSEASDLLHYIVGADAAERYQPFPVPCQHLKMVRYYGFISNSKQGKLLPNCYPPTEPRKVVDRV